MTTNIGTETTTEINQKAAPVAPECYGSGYASYQREVYGYRQTTRYRVMAQTCFTCAYERRCLAQQRVRKGR